MEKPVILARLGNPLLRLPQTWGRKVRDERLVIPLSQRLCHERREIRRGGKPESLLQCQGGIELDTDNIFKRLERREHNALFFQVAP